MQHVLLMMVLLLGELLVVQLLSVVWDLRRIGTEGLLIEMGICILRTTRMVGGMWKWILACLEGCGCGGCGECLLWGLALEAGGGQGGGEMGMLWVIWTAYLLKICTEAGGEDVPEEAEPFEEEAVWGIDRWAGNGLLALLLMVDAQTLCCVCETALIEVVENEGTEGYLGRHGHIGGGGCAIGMRVGRRWVVVE